VNVEAQQMCLDIDARTPGKKSRLRLEFDNGEINFYACSLKYLEGRLDDHYDWSADVLEAAWSPRKARAKLLADPGRMVCDALLDQEIFAGVGNIIKNEVLYRIGVQPASTVGGLPGPKLARMIKEARLYSFDFLEWKKQFVLKKHWLVHTRRTCPQCTSPILKQYLGTTNRRTFFCEHCQVRY
jgi:endonuclease-8